jgi:flagellar biogenesis protein FliO
MEYFKIAKSVLSAMIGVQKKKNLEEDFSQQSAMPFIIVGIIMVLVFLVTIWLVVQLVLNH